MNLKRMPGEQPLTLAATIAIGIYILLILLRMILSSGDDVSSIEYVDEFAINSEQKQAFLRQINALERIKSLDVEDFREVNSAFREASFASMCMLLTFDEKATADYYFKLAKEHTFKKKSDKKQYRRFIVAIENLEPDPGLALQCPGYSSNIKRIKR